MPPLILAAAATMLLLRWDDIPNTWVTHWGRGGRADGWTAKTPAGVFFPLVLGAGIWLLLAAIAWVVRRRVERRGDHRGRPVPVEAMDAMDDLLHIIATGVATLLAAMAVMLPLGRPRTPVFLLVLAAVIMGGALLLGSLRLKQGLKAARARDPQALEGWQGLTYRNPRDPRIWVPKMFGMGYTLNFAHRRAWLYLAALLALPLAIAVTVLIAAT
jgi:uncharacterized membrane protein